MTGGGGGKHLPQAYTLLKSPVFIGLRLKEAMKPPNFYKMVTAEIMFSYCSHLLKRPRHGPPAQSNMHWTLSSNKRVSIFFLLNP